MPRRKFNAINENGLPGRDNAINAHPTYTEIGRGREVPPLCTRWGRRILATMEAQSGGLKILLEFTACNARSSTVYTMEIARARNNRFALMLKEPTITFGLGRQVKRAESGTECPGL